MATRTPNLVRTTPEQDAAQEDLARQFVERLRADAPGQSMMFALIRELVRSEGVGTMHEFVDDADRELRGVKSEADEEFDRKLTGKLIRLCEAKVAATPKPIGGGKERFER